MCDATGMDKITTIATAAQAAGHLMEGGQQQNYYNFKADQANADAAYERGAGEVRAGKIRKAGGIQQSSVRAAYAGSGIDVSQGAPLATANTLERNIGEDAIAQLYTGERRAKVLESEAGGYRAAGSRAMTGGVLAAGRSILGGTAAAMRDQRGEDKWIRRQQLEFRDRKTAEFKAGGGFDDGEF